MHTKDLLAEALRAVGLNEMAEKAATGYYHDFLSPLAMPEMQLVDDLASAAAENIEAAPAILALRRRVTEGDFDASVEESEEWAGSEDGQEAMRRLLR